ncbi:MAG TPA: glycosyltransferase family 4 protein [Gemmatimonadaceae bacterium]|nr:glycosyltransferase family 4 protein [Gemmatimonadaceae bacterium]
MAGSSTMKLQQSEHGRTTFSRPAPLSILHLDTERGWRGGERQVLWLATSLARAGHNCIIAARANEPLAERAVESGIRVEGCSPLWEYDPLAAARLRNLIRTERIQIVHAHTAHAASLALLCTPPHTPVVITRRVDFPLKRNWMSRLKYRRADAIIAVSDAVARVMIEGGISPQRVETVRSGVDLKRNVIPTDGPTLNELGIPPGAPLVVMVAALARHKDPITFVRAMRTALSSVPNAHALLVGDGPLRGDVEHEIEALGIGDHVHMAGFRSDADSIMAAANVVTLSSTQEGLGTVLIDALYLGKPIAATRTGGIPELVEDGQSGLLANPGDFRALGAAIARLLSDSSLATRLSSAGRQKVAEMSVEQTAARTALVYQRVMSTAAMAS